MSLTFNLLAKEVVRHGYSLHQVDEKRFLLVDLSDSERMKDKQLDFDQLLAELTRLNKEEY